MPLEVGYKEGGYEYIGGDETNPKSWKILPGTIEDGYKFKGGDPADEKNWQSMVDRVPQMKVDPMEGMSGLEKFGAGIGSGMVDIARKGTAFVLPESITPDWASKEAIEEQKRIDAPLLKSGAGLAGNIVGGTVATLPLGGAIGGGAKLASKTGRLARTMKALQNPASLTRATAEGALAGAITADPGEGLGGAGLGAATSGAMSGGGKILKKALGTGFLKTSKPAQELIDEGVDIPLSAALEKKGASGLGRMLYRDILPNIPGGGQLKNQTEKAFAQGRQHMVEKMLPDSGWADDVVRAAHSADDPRATMKIIEDFWENTAYADIKQFPILVDTDDIKAAGDISPLAFKALKRVLKDRVGNKTEIMGDDLLNIKQDLQDLIYETKRRKQGPLIAAKNHVDKLFEDQLSGPPSSDAQQMLTRYKELNAPYARYMDVRRAAAKADQGEYTFKQLARASAQRAGQKKAAVGEGALQTVAEAYEDALGEPLTKDNMWRFTASMGLLGSMAYDPVIAPMVMGGVAGATTPQFQKGLVGNLQWQKAIEEMLRKGEPVTRPLGRAARLGTIQAIEEENN